MKLWPAKLPSVGILVILVSLTIQPVRGQGEAVQLQYKFAPGETLTYSYSSSRASQFRVSIYSESINEQDLRQIAGEQIINVKGVSDNGTMTLEIVPRLRITEQGRSIDAPSRPTEIQMGLTESYSSPGEQTPRLCW